jgi:hypothetical protein
VIAHALTRTAPAAAALLRLDARRKLLPLAFFCVLTGLDFRAAVELVENRVLAPAWNLASSEMGRRTIRVWRGSVETWNDGPTGPKQDLENVIRSALPMLGIADLAKVTVPGADLARRFCLSRMFIAVLTRSGLLREVGRHGRSETPRISYLSAKNLLETRIL